MSNVPSDAPEKVEAPVGNFVRAYAGGTLMAVQILAGWQRVIKVCMPDFVESAPTRPAVIELPPARDWGKDLTIVDTTGMGFVLRLSTGEVMLCAAEGKPVLRLTPVLSDRTGEPDGWAAA